MVVSIIFIWYPYMGMRQYLQTSPNVSSSQVGNWQGSLVPGKLVFEQNNFYYQKLKIFQGNIHWLDKAYHHNLLIKLDRINICVGTKEHQI